MTEKTLLTDLEVGFITNNIGIDPITDLQICRRFKGLYSDTHEKKHIITYEEWLIAKDGKVYEEFYRIKNYIVVDILDDPQYLAYTQWFTALEPTLAPSINNTLNNIPKNAESGYVTTL